MILAFVHQEQSPPRSSSVGTTKKFSEVPLPWLEGVLAVGLRPKETCLNHRWSTGISKWIIVWGQRAPSSPFLQSGRLCKYNRRRYKGRELKLKGNTRGMWLRESSYVRPWWHRFFFFGAKNPVTSLDVVYTQFWHTVCMNKWTTLQDIILIIVLIQWSQRRKCVIHLMKKITMNQKI